MTRRIALAILLTVWAILVAGCTTAYFTMRWVLIDQLDRSLIKKAAAIPELRSIEGATPTSAARNAQSASGSNLTLPDRYVVKNANGQTISPPTGGSPVADPVLLSASF